MPQPPLPPPTQKAKDTFAHRSPHPVPTPCALTLVLLAWVCPHDGKRERKDEAHLGHGCCPTPPPPFHARPPLSPPMPNASFIVVFEDGWRDTQSDSSSTADKGDASGSRCGAEVMRQNQRSSHHSPPAASALLSRHVPSAKVLRACRVGSPCTHLRRPPHPFHFSQCMSYKSTVKVKEKRRSANNAYIHQAISWLRSFRHLARMCAA